ncbi:MAG TPA: hypothetical protein VN698_14520 [Bacteroidia bacterium]|nr:hypothetical protein [Bacteroidia bacterium]
MNNNVTTSIEKLIERAEDYGKTTVELFKFKIIDKASEVVSSLVSKLILFVVVALFAFIINIGLSLWIGEILGKPYYGFFVMAAFYLFVAVIVYAGREKWIKNPTKNSIIAQMLKTK